jgi:hypothetical protein
MQLTQETLGLTTNRTLTRASGTLSHWMGEGWGEGPAVSYDLLTRASGTLSHRMGEGWGEGPGVSSVTESSI